ncbi:MAG: hypothetical protein GKR91_06710 [Pseudomonadales bacterium]|nr:hypothetical protein [Pseudomonadales bacterium]
MGAISAGIRFSEGTDNYPEFWNTVVHPLNNDVIYAASLDSPGPVTDDFPSSIGGVYKSIDGGENWFRANCGLVNSRATAIAIDPAAPNRVLLGIEGGAASFSELQGEFFEGGIYLSSDDGSAWNKLDIHEDDVMNGFTNILPYGSGGQFIAFGFYREDTSRNVGFVRISDSGASTELFAEELRDLIIPWYDVSSDGEVIYAIEQDSFLIRKTTNAGQSWESMQQQANGPIAVSPVDADEILFAQASQLRKSSDGGTNAEIVLEADNQIHDIMHAPSDPNIVYVATEGYLVYKSTDNGESFEFLGNLRESVLNTN